jgi:DNA replication and repair protein RecF
LDVWDEPLAASGSALLLGRARALAEIETLAAPLHRRLTHGAETLHVRYCPAWDPSRPGGDPPEGQRELPIDAAVDHTKWKAADIRGMLLGHLRDGRDLAIRRGLTGSGPHRDEIRFLANGIDLTSYGSRGQARTALLALKLAEVEWLRKRSVLGAGCPSARGFARRPGTGRSGVHHRQRSGYASPLLPQTRPRLVGGGRHAETVFP